MDTKFNISVIKCEYNVLFSHLFGKNVSRLLGTTAIDDKNDHPFLWVPDCLLQCLLKYADDLVTSFFTGHYGSEPGKDGRRRTG